MGVSGSGKTSIGGLLAEELDVPFFDADDYHPQSNIDKMSSGIPLTDKDRWPWLQELNNLAANQQDGCVIACSALKKSYRDRLANDLESRVIWIYLKGSFEQILDRMLKRKHHYMRSSMLQSQFDSLEEPKEAIQVDISSAPEVIVDKLLSELR